MCRPGRTHRSCAVSNTLIFWSRSSDFIFPLLDDELVALVDPHVIQFVEAFLPAGDLQSARCPENPRHRNPLPDRTLLVAALAVLDFGLEIVTDDPEPGLLGRFDVHLPLSAGRVRVVHNEWLAGLDARLQETTLTVPGPEHVEVDAHVRGKEPFTVERRFARAL